MQGNLIWNKPIPKIQRVKELHFYNEYVYIIGDTISSPNFVDVIQKFDSSGTLVWQTATLNAGSYNYTDSEIDTSSNLWVTGYTNSNSKAYLSKVDSLGAIWDTLLSPITGPAKISINSQGEIFWAYIRSTMNGKFCDVLKVNSTGTNWFATIDTAEAVTAVSPYVFNVDINSLSNGSIKVANTRRVSFVDKDYEISSFDSNSNLDWN